MRFLFFLLGCSTIFAAPQAVIFDFGGVITTTDRKPLISFIHRTFNSNAENDFDKDKLFAAIMENEDFWKKYAELHKKTLPDHWMEMLNQEAKSLVTPIPGMEELIDQLKAQGYKIALLSNTTAVRSTYFRDKGFYKPFDPIVLSSDVGVEKPNPEIYKIMLTRLKLPASECIFVDNEERNIKAANKLGFHGILFKSTEQLRERLSKVIPLNQKATSTP